MSRNFLAAAIGALSLTAVSSAASACPNGYHTVWIQGNPVCKIDASASNKLASPDGRKKRAVKPYVGGAPDKPASPDGRKKRVVKPYVGGAPD